MAGWRIKVSWDPDTENGNVDHSNDDGSSDLQFLHKLLILSDDPYSIYDDLHEELDFKNPEK